MSSTTGDKVIYFLAGAGIGAAIALLFAPKSGRETREILARKGREGAEFISQKVDEGRQIVGTSTRRFAEEASNIIERGKDSIHRQKESLSAAIEAGKQAYVEEKSRGASAE